MASKNYQDVFQKVLKAGKSRNYQLAIHLLEDMAARGLAEKHPEILLYLARSHHSLGNFSKAISSARTYLSLEPKDAAGWFFLGRSYFAVTEYELAVYSLRKSLALNSRSVDARVFLGYSYLRAKKPVLAREIFEQALYYAPDDMRLNQGYLNALFIEAVRNYRQGNSELARQMLTFLINNDIDGVVPRLYLGHALRDLGFLNEAYGQYCDALSFSPQDISLKWYPVSIMFEQGQVQKALEIMQDFGLRSTIKDPSAPVVAFEIIKNHIEQEKWSEAVDACRVFIKTHGDNAHVQSLMGEGFRNLGNARLALVHFNRALKIDKKDPSPYYGIIMVYVAEQDWIALDQTINKAIQAGCDSKMISLYSIIARSHLETEPKELLPEIQEALKTFGAIPELMIALAQTYFKIGLYDLSIGWYQKGIELNSENEVAWLGYIASCEQLLAEPDITKKDYQFYQNELITSYTGYIKRWNDNSQIIKDCVQFLVTVADWEKAVEYTELLLAREPSAKLERKLAFYKRKAGQFRNAAILYRKQLRAQPKNRSLLVNLVYCLDQMKETKLAYELMHKANKVFSADCDFYLIEGRLLDKLGNQDAALEVFRKAVNLFPLDARCWEEVALIYENRGIHEIAMNYRQKAKNLELKNKNS